MDQEKLTEFFKRIAILTLEHDVIQDYACVTANKLGECLDTIDPEWTSKASRWQKELNMKVKTKTIFGDDSK